MEDGKNNILLKTKRISSLLRLGIQIKIHTLSKRILPLIFTRLHVILQSLCFVTELNSVIYNTILGIGMLVPPIPVHKIMVGTEHAGSNFVFPTCQLQYCSSKQVFPDSGSKWRRTCQPQRASQALVQICWCFLGRKQEVLACQQYRLVSDQTLHLKVEIKHISNSSVLWLVGGTEEEVKWHPQGQTLMGDFCKPETWRLF